MIRVRPLLLSLTLLAVLPPGVAAQIAATGSPHGPSPEGSSCTLCHTATDWKARPKSMAFDHSQQTEFELSGRHGELDCRQCHLDLRWSEPKIAANECASCHFDVHRGNLSANCRSCHTTESFAEVPGVAVHAQTTFPLTGAHLQVTCETCHTESQAGAFFGTLDSECIACHEEDYATTQLVDHVATGFPTDCQQCHETLTWTGGTVFDHVSISNGYLLVGAHDGMRCASCHIPPSGDLIFTPSDQNDCFACHQRDYNSEHGQDGFPTTCLDCHTQQTWDGADFRHASVGTGFDLVGAHASLPCASCHIQPGNGLKFSTTDQNDCIACHQADYDRDHAGSGFPTTCLACHTNGTFGGATFADHDAQFFPVYSGVHAGKWNNDCTTCHTVPSDFAIHTCFSCHEHDQAKAADQHTSVPGYSYQSAECLRCHPDGRN